MANKLVACISCGDFIEVKGETSAFISQGGRCAKCQGLRKLAGKFGSLLIQGAGVTQRELAEIKREFYQLYQIDKALEARKIEFMRKAQEEMERVIAEVEGQIGQPVKELRARKAQLEAQLKTFMEESKTSEMVIRDLLVEVREQIINRGNMPQYKNIVEDLRQLLEWSEEEMEAFVKQHYSQPQYGNVMTVKPLPPGRRKKTGPTASRRLAAEDEPKKDEHVEFRQAAPEEFHRAVSKVSKYKHMLTPLSPEEYATMRCFLNKDGTVGYALTEDNDLKSVFNVSKHRGAGLAAVEDAIRKGAETLDAFDGFLPGYYKQFGFEEFDRAKFDPAQAPPAWDVKEHGKPDVVFMRRQREKGPVAAYYAHELTFPRMAYIHDDFLRNGSAICKVETPEEVFILTGKRVKENGLATMIALQKQTKRTLSVVDVENLHDGTVHVLLEGSCASDPNTVLAFLAERIEGHEAIDVHYDSPTRVAVELQPVEKIAASPLDAAMGFFDQMAATIANLAGIERKRYQKAEMLMEQTTARNQSDTPDNVDDLSLKYERGQPAGGNPGSFGSGTAADGGIMSPNGGAPLISTGGRRGA